MTPSVRPATLRLRPLPATVPPGEAGPIDYRELRGTTPPPPEAAGDAGAANRIPAYIAYHWPTVLILGSVIGAALAFAAYSVVPAKYSTTALIRVAQVQPSLTGFQTEEAARNDFLTQLKTQSTLIKSGPVLTAAIRDSAIADLPLIKSQVDPVRYLEETLEVSYSDNSEIIKVTLAGDNADEIARIVNAVKKAYFSEIVEKEARVRNERLDELERTLVALKTTNKSRFQAIRDKRELDSGARPPQVDLVADDPLAEPGAPKPAPPATVVAADDPVAAATAAAQEVARANAMAHNEAARHKQTLFNLDGEAGNLTRRLERLRGLANAPAPADPDAEGRLSAALEKEPQLAAQSRRVATARKQHALYVATKQPGSSYIAIAARDLAAAEAEFQSLTAQATETFHKLEADAWRAKLAAEIQATETTLVERADQRKFVADTLARALAEVKPVPPVPSIRQAQQLLAAAGKAEPDPLVELDSARLDIESGQDMMQKLTSKINLLRLEQKAPARVRPMADASVPQKREFKKQLIASAGGGLMGFVVVALGVVMFEARVRRAMGLSDLTSAARGPVLGVIPGDPDAAPGPMSDDVAEAVDKCRAMLVQHTLAADLKTVMITSAAADDGKSLFAWQLTQSFVQAGYRTLLIDFDLRTPRMHELYGVLNESGVCEVLRGQADLNDAVQTFADGLSFLPAGTWDDAMRQELVTNKVGELLTRVREFYDCVLIHSHPLLARTDSILVGRHAEAVVLTARKYASRLPLIDRALDRAGDLGKDEFGLVFLGASDAEALC